MGTFLHNLGEFTFRKKWWIVSGWLVILAIIGIVAAKQYQPPTSAITIPGTEAQTTLDRFAELFPDAGKGTGRVVFDSQRGTKIEDHKEAITKSVDELRKIEGVSRVVGPFDMPGVISNDHTVGYATISLSEGSDSISKDTVAAIESIVEKTRENNLAVEMGGDVISKVPGEILGIGEVAGVVIALIVLVMTLGSLVAAGLPIVVALATVVGGAAGLFALSHVITITSTTPVLAIMLGLAVGIDYSLFIVNKYRHYLLQGYSYKEAAARSVATAGNAVLFAALTVVIALSALAIVGIPFMTSMGLAAAATVALAALVAVTLLPALLGIVQARIFRGKTRRAIEAAQKKGPHESHRVSHKTIWYKVAERIAKHPVRTLLLGVVIAGVIALPVRSLHLGLPTDEYAATDTTQRKAYESLKRGFGEGFNGPLVILAENVTPVSDSDAQAVRAQLTDIFTKKLTQEKETQTAAFQVRLASAETSEQMMQVQQDIQAAQAAAPAREAAARAQLEAQIRQYTQLSQLSKLAERIQAMPGVEKAVPLLVTQDTTKGVIQVVSKTSPTSEETKSLIKDLRTPSTVEHITGSSAVTLGVTGSTALQMDINDKLAAALPQYLLVVVGLSFVLLVIVFRSILVPLKATAGFLLSVAAMFGAMVAVFQWGWFGIADAPGPIVSFIPIISIGVLFGLAMDYEFFLVSSIHEEYERTKEPKRAVIDGYAIGSRVVVAAAVIMVAVFAGFVTNHDATIQAIGFGLAVGVLIDAFVIRLMIVPAVMVLLGRSAWWLPKGLDKALPRISIEGNDH